MYEYNGFFADAVSCSDAKNDIFAYQLSNLSTKTWQYFNQIKRNPLFYTRRLKAVTSILISRELFERKID